MEKLKMETPSGAQKLFAKLAKLVPECVVEKQSAAGGGRDNNLTHAIDFDKLKQLLDDHVREGEEAYEFTWVGKKAALVEANTPIQKTLRPVKEESKDWDTTENLYIEGDNLDALKLLQESYLGKVKMIYIDPPYNTGNDFIYNDDFKQSFDEYEEESGHVDEDGNRMKVNHETDARFHSKWCSMIYSRLRLARNLLADDGVIFISIDDNEQANLKKICDEVFGEENYIGEITVINNLKGRNDKKDIATCHEYLLLYGKAEFVAGGIPLTQEQRQQFNKIDKNGNAYKLRDLRKRGRPDRREDRPNMYFPIYYNEKTTECSLEKQEGWIEILPLRGDGSDGRWRWGKDRVKENLAILEPQYSKIAKRWGVQHRVYLNPSLNPCDLCEDEDGNDGNEVLEERSSKSKSFWMGGELSSDVGRRQLKKIFDTAYFDYPKSVDFIVRTLYMGCNFDGIILDFFSGSATTAHAVMQLNAEDGGHRKFIMVQLPEATDEKSEAYKAGYKNICEIGKERIRRAGAKILAEHPEAKDLDTGFRVLRVDSSNMKDVYYRADEVTQASLIDAVDNVKEDRSALDLLFGCLVDWGLPLSLPYAEETIAGVPVLNYSDGDLIACFAAAVPEAAVRAIAERQPLRAVFRDSSFADSPARINVEEIFRLLSPDTDLRVL